jgi:hypothetical protein
MGVPLGVGVGWTCERETARGNHLTFITKKAFIPQYPLSLIFRYPKFFIILAVSPILDTSTKTIVEQRFRLDVENI